jgi:hypothetical protein
VELLGTEDYDGMGVDQGRHVRETGCSELALQCVGPALDAGSARLQNSGLYRALGALLRSLTPVGLRCPWGCLGLLLVRHLLAVRCCRALGRMVRCRLRRKVPLGDGAVVTLNGRAQALLHVWLALHFVRSSVHTHSTLPPLGAWPMSPPGWR